MDSRDGVRVRRECPQALSCLHVPNTDTLIKLNMIGVEGGREEGREEGVENTNCKYPVVAHHVHVHVHGSPPTE